MRFIDTHCHIHDSEFYPETREDVYQESVEAGVFMLCVGTDLRSSKEAVAFARSHSNAKAVVGVHPHEAKHGCEGIEALIEANREIIVGIGEIGLDYFYTHSDKASQSIVLKKQLALAQQYELPVSFHVREAFNDFWEIFDQFEGVRGVLHSFTDNEDNLQRGLERGLFIGVNGISTFTKDEAQQKLFSRVPLKSLLLETDAPFLTPSPFRGKINSPAYIGRVAAHQAEAKGISLDDIASATSKNARTLFRL